MSAFDSLISYAVFFTDSSAAASAKCVNAPIRRASFLSRKLSGSKPLTSHANFTENFSVSNFFIYSAPLTPLRRARQVVGTSFPTAVTKPSPVTTTRRLISVNRKSQIVNRKKLFAIYDSLFTSLCAVRRTHMHRERSGSFQRLRLGSRYRTLLQTALRARPNPTNQRRGPL